MSASARSPKNVAAQAKIVRALNELVKALDSRLPQVNRVGEASIASAAKLLKAEALKRIAQIEAQV